MGTPSSGRAVEEPLLYFGHADPSRRVSILRRPVLWLTGQPLVRTLTVGHPLGKRVASRFVAGETLDQGIHAAQQLNVLGIGAMLNHLGESVTSAETAATATDHYVQALKRIRESPSLDCNISVKLTQLGLDVGPDVARENLERVLDVAEESTPATLVMVDMESREYVDRTLDLYLALRDRHPAVGLCVQTYLRRSADDVRRIAGPEAIIRLAKGAYLEPADVVFGSRREVSASYALLTSTLLLSGSVVHLATHDPQLLDGAVRFIRARSISNTRYEFQMMYGIRRDLQRRLVGEGEPVRVYVPYGTQWYPYLTRRLAERPANIWFFASNAIRPKG
jgi:proline dehydrogenase